MLARGSRSMVLLRLCGPMEGRAPRSGSPPLVGATVRARWTDQPCPRGHDTERTWNGAGERGAARAVISAIHQWLLSHVQLSTAPGCRCPHGPGCRCVSRATRLQRQHTRAVRSPGLMIAHGVARALTLAQRAPFTLLRPCSPVTENDACAPAPYERSLMRGRLSNVLHR